MALRVRNDIVICIGRGGSRREKKWWMGGGRVGMCW